ncbi:hypothetical protein D3C78_1778740 [compost metagenome]
MVPARSLAMPWSSNTRLFLSCQRLSSWGSMPIDSTTSALRRFLVVKAVAARFSWLASLSVWPVSRSLA